MKKAAQADAHAPAVAIPLAFILAGVLSLLVGSVWLVARPDILAGYHYNQYVISLTHLIVLGWISSVVMGAMYQLVPVALETRLHNPKLARWHWWLHVPGVAGMVWMFWVWNMKEVGHFGSAFGFGVFLFAYNIARTLRRVPRWNVVATGVSCAVGWLVITMLAGLYLASAKCWPSINLFAPIPQMHAHAHLGVLGVFIMLIVGVSYKLLPMFLLSEMQSQSRAAWSLALLNAGLVISVAGILMERSWKIAGTLTVVAGLAVYGWEVMAILQARKRATLDWGLKYLLTALVILVPVGAIAVILSWPGLAVTERMAQLENVYGFLGVYGVVTLALLGMLYKIVPFLVWYSSYSKWIGRARVPSLNELYSTRLQALGYWPFLAGLCGGGIGALFGSEPVAQMSCGILALAVVLFVVNLLRILSHLVRPRLGLLEETTGKAFAQSPISVVSSTPSP